MIEKLNMTMLTDFYEITMANGYFEAGMQDDIAYFDMFFRRNPFRLTASSTSPFTKQ